MNPFALFSGETQPTRTKQQRIAMIHDNLTQNERVFKEGKRDKRTYLVCKAEGKKAIAEIRAGR